MAVRWEGGMMSPDDNEVSAQLVLQRIRNRILDYLELASSRDAQLAYQAAAPVPVAYELFNQWDDWFRGDPSSLADPAFTEDERSALTRFHSALNEAADLVPQTVPDLAIFQALPGWSIIQRAATEALCAFAHRGRLPEDAEISST
jgi:hypothetical protein